jgi:hypothetical protein
MVLPVQLIAVSYDGLENEAYNNYLVRGDVRIAIGQVSPCKLSFPSSTQGWTRNLTPNGDASFS